MSFADLADELDAKPAQKSGGFGALADTIQVGPKPKKQQADYPPVFKTNDPAKMRQDILNSNDPQKDQLLASFDAQFPQPQAGAGRGLMPPSAYARPAGQPLDIPQPHQGPYTTPAEPSLLQKAGAVAQATSNTAGGVIGGAAGLLYGGLEGLGGNVENAVRGKPYYPIDKVIAQRAKDFTPELPQALRTPLGQEYTEKVGDFIQRNAPSLMGAAPEAGVIAGAIKNAGTVARDVGMGGMADAFRAKQGIPAPGVVTGIESASPELRAAVQQAAAKGPVNQAAVGRHVEADSLPVKVQLTAGQATGNPTLISDEMNSRAGARVVPPEFYQAQEKNLGQNLDVIRSRVAPDVAYTNDLQRGQAQIDAYKAMDETVRADIAAKYKALSDANGGSLPVSGQTFVQAADQALKKQMKGRYVPSQVEADLNDLRAGGPMTFENFENLRTNLAAEGRKAARAGDGNAEAAVSIVREALESLPMEGEAANIKPLADAARSAARARFDALRADPAYKAAANDSVGLGDASPLADNFMNNYVIKGKTANVAKMRESLADNPTALQNMSDAALSHLQGAAKTGEGKFIASAYGKQLGGLKPKLDLLVDPQTAKELETLGNVAGYTTAQPRGSYVNNSNTFVAAAKEAAKGAAEGAANVAAHGVPVGTWTRKILANRSSQKAARDAIKPGAGIGILSDLAR